METGVAIFSLFASGAVRADMPDSKTFLDLEQAGYVFLDRINTPLLYPLATGKPFDAKLLLLIGRQDLPNNQQQIAGDLELNDEFRRHAALVQMQPFLDDRTSALKQAKGYIVPLNAQLGEYDFGKHRFPLHLSLLIQVPKSADSYHCSGAYEKVQNARVTVCVRTSNWNEHSSAFQYLVVDDENQAQQIKQQFQNNKVGFFFVIVPDGGLHSIANKRIQYGSFFDRTLISSVQTARVLGLILLDFSSGNILISGSIHENN